MCILHRKCALCIAGLRAEVSGVCFIQETSGGVACNEWTEAECFAYHSCPAYTKVMRLLVSTMGTVHLSDLALVHTAQGLGMGALGTAD